MLKKLLLLVVLVFSAHYSYSESITPYYGQTGNAAVDGNRWVMDNILPPDIPGLDITGVLYNYRINKPTDETVSVHIQNERANGSGYIFRETDDWLPGSLSGTAINKVVPVAPSNRSLWGDGSIAVDGNGSVEEPRVLYNYKVDPCYNPQFDPNCPGYQTPMPTIVEVDPSTLYDVMNDENVTLNQETEEVYDDEEKELTDEELAEQEAEEKKDREERLEKALAAVDNSAMFANAFANSMILQQQNNKVNMNQYYSKYIAGGEYNESIALDGGNIPDNPQGRRLNFSTQKLHEEMVDMQYNR
jgi:hypothetical protein